MEITTAGVRRDLAETFVQDLTAEPGIAEYFMFPVTLADARPLTGGRWLPGESLWVVDPAESGIVSPDGRRSRATGSEDARTMRMVSVSGVSLLVRCRELIGRRVVVGAYRKVGDNIELPTGPVGLMEVEARLDSGE